VKTQHEEKENKLGSR